MINETFYLYENRKDVTLTTYIQDSESDLLKDSTRPAVIICPGGSYMYCSDREAEPVALRFAAMGYHAFVLRYSVYNEGKGKPDKEDITFEYKEHCVFPNPMREIAMSFELIQRHAKEWHIDTEAIGTCGFSAGGHNCATYANMWQDEIITSAVSIDTQQLKPAFNVLGYPLTDYYNMFRDVEHPVPDNVLLAGQAFSLACFGTHDPHDHLLKKWSPIYNVNQQTPPTFLWTTMEDDVVSVNDSLRLAQALSDKSVPFELHVYEKGPHGLSLADHSTAMHASKYNPHVSTWFNHVQEWLLEKFPI